MRVAPKKNLFWKHECSNNLGKLSADWEDNIKINLKEKMWDCMARDRAH
jgi:hypothetical protein